MTLTETDDPTIRINPAHGLDPFTNTLTVLVTDAAGSTVFLEARSPVFPNKRPEATREGALLPGNPAFSIITQYDGQLIRTVGGSVMVEFSSPIGAVRAAVEIQRLLAESNSAAPHGRALDLRIGVHACTAHRPGMDVFGDVVSVAAGLTKHAAPGQILVSRAVCEAVSGEADLYCPWLSQVAIHGRIDKEDIFEVNWAAVPANIPSRYEVLSQVGMGGTGMVYKVRDLETQEIVALKILKPGIAADPAMQENLRREVRLARKVTHKRVCRIHEFSRSNGAAYISMEFVEGESLLSTLRLGRLPLDQALRIARQICAGLHEAHLHGIVHRDLKPANIMVEPSGDVKIMDFGIARLSQGNGQMTGTIAGTPAYMAPEQVELKPVGAPADIYALGLVLYEMVTGIPAFAGDTPIAVALKQVRDLPRPPREIILNLPAHIESIILKCLQKDPAERFQSVDELEAALEHQLLPASPKRVSLGPQIQTAGAAAARMLRAASARTSLFAGTTSRTARTLQRQASSAIAEACTNLRRKDWQAFAKTRAGQASVVAAGVALCLLLSAVIAVALARTRSRSSVPLAASSEQSPASRANQPMKPFAVSNLSASPEKSAVTSGPVDLGPGAGYERENFQNIALAAQPTSAPTTKAAKIASNNSAALAAKRKPAHAPDANAHPALPVPPPTPSDVAQVVNDQKLVDASLDSSASVALAVVPPAADVKSAEAPNTGKPKGAIEVPSSFFEVGTFKETTWADSAVQTLTQLGFHAVSVRKSRLWNQSYHVQVGPYTDPQALEAARLSLTQQGFKPHLINGQTAP
jgi:serine/threonine protein kinase